MFLPIIASVVVSQTITPIHTYNNLENGIMVKIDLAEDVDTARLVLLDNENNLLAPPATVSKGTHDLTSRIPEIKKITQAAWLQLYIKHTAVGSSYVIQPMTSREVPVVEEATRPGGKATYTKIIEWEDEAAEDELPTPYVSGWRIYVDKDAILKTSEGDIRVELRPDKAPNTVWNFRELANGGFYENTTFHRVVPMTSKGHPFVIQGGDPTGTGSGGPGYWLPIENSDLPHDFGVISMARASDPDSAGSQFFFCLSREGTARLDGQYCSFGETVEGDDVIKKISSTPLADPSSGKPVSPPTIYSITLVPAKVREVKQ
jgi:peptidyl-prolyl cis-trans isomerase B (cyclophilin B)